MDGLIKDIQGSVLLDGEDIRKLTPKDIYRKVGLVFQNPDDQLFAHTVFEDVAFGPRNMGFAEPEVAERVNAALRSVEMAEYAGKIDPPPEFRPEKARSASPASSPWDMRSCSWTSRPPGWTRWANTG